MVGAAGCPGPRLCPHRAAGPACRDGLATVAPAGPGWPGSEGGREPSAEILARSPDLAGRGVTQNLVTTQAHATLTYVRSLTNTPEMCYR